MQGTSITIPHENKYSLLDTVVEGGEEAGGMTVRHQPARLALRHNGKG